MLLYRTNYIFFARQIIFYYSRTDANSCLHLIIKISGFCWGVKKGSSRDLFAASICKAVLDLGQALAARIKDAGARVVVTADEAVRKTCDNAFLRRITYFSCR